MKSLQIVSNHTCPFVQRAIIVARLKDINLDISYIDLTAKPDWFLAISPTGRVPVLRTEQGVLFESIAICEYLNDLVPTPPLLADDIYIRAEQRAWVNATNDPYGIAHQVARVITDPQAFTNYIGALGKAFTTIAPFLHSPWFDDKGPSLVDVFWYPLMSRTALIEKASGQVIMSSAVRSWYDALHSHDAFAGSVVEDFSARYYQAIRNSNSLLAAQFKAA